MHLPPEIVPVPAPVVTGAGIAVLNAAADLFYSRGIHATGVDALAEHAGVTKRTLYQHFRSKDALAAAYLQERAHRWQRLLVDGLLAEPGDPLDLVYGAAAEWAGRSGRGCAFVNAWAELGHFDHPGVAVVVAEKAWMARLFTLLASEDGQLGTALHLVYEGAQVCASIQRSSIPLEAARLTSQRMLGATGG